jgi:L-lactate dehydrogenase complex protein LldG
LPDLDAAPVRRVGPADDLVAVFVDQATRSGLKVIETSASESARRIAALIGDRSAAGDRPKVVVEPGLEVGDGLVKTLGDAAEFVDPRRGDDDLFAADVGVTGVFAAVAETGSLACASGDALWRGTSLIPPVHVAVVRERDIVPDLLDLLGGLTAETLPANLTLISGPSKTADIEGILITGVHGPGAVHVVLIREAGGQSGRRHPTRDGAA